MPGTARSCQRSCASCEPPPPYWLPARPPSPTPPVPPALEPPGPSAPPPPPPPRGAASRFRAGASQLGDARTIGSSAVMGVLILLIVGTVALRRRLAARVARASPPDARQTSTAAETDCLDEVIEL